MSPKKPSDEPTVKGVSVEKFADGSTVVRISKGSGITPKLMAERMGGDLHFLDKAGKKAVVVMEGRPYHADDEEHVNALSEIVEKIRGHLSSGRIRGEAAEDIAELFRWMTDDIKLRNRRSRETVLRIAQHVSDVDSAHRRKGADRMRENDPKTAAKRCALELWKERQAGKHPSLRRVQDFAMEVMRRWPVLTNSRVIEGWSAKWSKQVKQGQDPTC